ncbi:hypothetical protein Amsp01_052340 [Amycolatopsis sp. NBRC 101858]|uniref:hypothetical protein n=1 Tax=Amycolatopsis sp. NBRC 101858 TaxID=3032200 RepID=UPI0024A01ECE|nr:hypothetical protein [Amycolatopsis sp. NBRC 101858]GLY39210.1 hypothetical protein Amsp01_052340 [Amycolatopsis sp. NBRC 101858]
MTLLLKLVLAPLLVVGSSLAGRRWGPGLTGLLVALPLVAGPILLITYLEQGPAFAARAASASLLGLVSLAAFAVVFARVSRARGWAGTVLQGWLVCLSLDLALSFAPVPVWVALGLALAAAWAGMRLLPVPGEVGPVRGGVEPARGGPVPGEGRAVPGEAGPVRGGVEPAGGGPVSGEGRAVPGDAGPVRGGVEPARGGPVPGEVEPARGGVGPVRGGPVPDEGRPVPGDAGPVPGEGKAVPDEGAPVPGEAGPVALPWWDLPARAVVTAGLVLVVTTAAGWLGPGLTGVLAPFPTALSVVAVFALAQGGPPAAAATMRGLLRGLGGFAAFCFLVAVLVEPLGGWAFVLAAGGAVAGQLVYRRQAPRG